MFFKSISKRSYATVNGMISREQAKLILQNPKKTASKKNMIAPRQVYLHALYEEMVRSRSMFIVQVNNLTSKEYDQFQLELRKVNFRATLIKNSWFKNALKNSNNLKNEFTNQVIPTNQKLLPKKTDLDLMKHMIVGPTTIVFNNQPEEDLSTIDVIKNFHSIFLKSNKRLMCIGAKLDGMVLTFEQLEKLRKDFPRGIEGLREELLGLLDSSSRGLINILEDGPNKVAMLLEQRSRDLNVDN